MKTVIYIGDYTQDFRSIPREKYLTVQQYAYNCMRSRNDAGFPYGPVLTTIMDFTIRLQLPEDSKEFHKRMHDNNPYSYSFICDPEFITSGKKIMKDFMSAMIVVGHIVDVEETMDAKPDVDGFSKQIEVHIKLLVSEITYIGKNQSKKLILKQDAPEPEDKDPDSDNPEPTPPETVDSFSKYALFIGKSAPAEEIDGGITHSVSQSFTKDSHTVNALLKSLTYHKKIFQPNEIKAILSLTWDASTPPSFKTLTDIFMYKRAELKVVDNATKLDQIIAKNYFVYQMKPNFKRTGNGSSIDVELHLFSLDKLTTLDKFSKAHTAQKLGKEIFTPELQSFNVGGMALQGYTQDMQFLGISGDEMRIPYAVQYDESFYAFLQRITQRYGEFLYFENGKLRIGMKPSESNYWIDSTKKQTKDWAASADLKNRYYESLLPNVLEVQEEYSSYLDRKNKDSKIYLNTIDSSTLSIKDLIGSVIVKSESNYYNPDMVSADENLDSIKKNDYTSISAKYQYYEKFIFEEVFNALKGTSLAGILSNLVVAEGLRVAKNALAARNDNDLYNKINFEVLYSDNDYDFSDQKDGDKLAQFSSIKDNTAFSTKLANGIVNFSSRFYSIIRNMENDVANKAVFLEFGEHTQPFALGDKIHVDGIDYVIIEIEGKAEKEEDVFSDTQKVVAIPYYKPDILVPPALPIPRIREAKPQTAFITVSAFEPQKIGRVRFRYPWQGGKEPASPWVRVALPFTTNGGGVNFRPEIGDEAMIDYEGGNIDKPFVAGFMASPYLKQTWGSTTLPDRGMMSKNGHSVSFADGLDGMNFFWGWLPILGTLKGFIPTAEWPDSLKEKDNQKIVDLVGGTTITDRYGLYKISGSSDGRNITLQSPMGDISVNAFTGIKIEAPNGDISINGKNVSIKACDKITLESGSNLKNRFVDSDFLKNLGMGLLNGVSKVVEKALDLSFLRTVMEVFLRPIDGTLKIKSTTFTMIEAGPGKVEVPRGSYNRDPKDYLSDDELNDKTNLFKKIKNTLAVVDQTANTLVNKFVEVNNAYCTALTGFKGFLINNDAGGTIISFNEIKTKAQGNHANDSSTLSIGDNDIHADAAVLADPPVLPEEQPEPKRDDFGAGLVGDLDYQIARLHWNEAREARPHLVEQRDAEIAQKTQKKNLAKEKATALLRAMNDLYLTANNWRHYDVVFPEGVAENNVFKADVIDKLTQEAELTNSPLKIADALALNLSGDVRVWDLGIEEEKIILKRKMVVKMLALQDMQNVFKVKAGLQIADADISDAGKWAKFVDGIYADDTTGTKVKEWFYEHYAKPFVDIADAFYRNKMWGPKVKGQILFSDNATKTVSFSRNGMNDANNVGSISTRFEAEIKRILGDIK
ncbi:MAG: hypothetical protein J6U14_10710 [Bacteroidaceae bacterium]|nr:hypothetical protein [Bacteroidaceae bacterium]